MATFAKAISNDLFDNILPTYGKPRMNMPTWDDSQKMFICEEYESATGHRYYSGVRFCDRVAIREKVGMYHTWTYIDSIELFAFNGTKLELIQKKDYDKVFRSEEFVKKESQMMVRNYLAGVLKASRVALPEADLQEKAEQLVEGCYKSFLSENFNNRLTKIIPELTEK